MENYDLLGLSGGEILHQHLISHGVDHVFGHPRAAVPSLFGDVYKSPVISFIPSRHERGAGHMAEGYAKATRRPGVVFVGTDPRSSNMVTPMLDGLLNRTPMVVICGQAPDTKGTDGYQELSIIQQARACTKWRTSVQRLGQLPKAIDAAFAHAGGKQPGPTLVDILPGIGESVFDSHALQDSSNVSLVVQELNGLARGCISPSGSADYMYEKIVRVADVINQSRTPVICAGNGVLATARGCKLLSKISRKAQIPVATTLLGLGSFDETREEALHMIGIHGAPYANYAIRNADLLIVVGATLDERAVGNSVGFAAKALDKDRGGRGIVHFDINAEKLGKVIQPTEIILGDLSETLPILISLLTPVDERDGWLDQIQMWKKEYPFQIPVARAKNRPHPEQVVAELNRQTTPMKSSTTVTTSIGQHQMWTSQHFRCTHPHSLITSGSFTTMGFSLPAAIGAKLALPDQQVIAMDGDASFCTTMEELITALQHQIQIKVIVFNSRPGGALSPAEKSVYDINICCDSKSSLDFDRLARSMGCQGQRCERVEDLPHAIYWLLRCRGPALLDVATSEPEVIPIASSGTPQGTDVGIAYCA
ncbi:thiamine pyrophosphate-binding protein [Aspergillus alliaceus]|nr:thiamine diphosphate-binding protein [Aspergillus alliaceus]KAB8237499.1 thiamine diphosphate-binding protein [Aspergillus alliaceus]